MRLVNAVIGVGTMGARGATAPPIISLPLKYKVSWLHQYVGSYISTTG